MLFGSEASWPIAKNQWPPEAHPHAGINLWVPDVWGPSLGLRSGQPEPDSL